MTIVAVSLLCIFSMFTKDAHSLAIAGSSSGRTSSLAGRTSSFTKKQKGFATELATPPAWGMALEAPAASQTAAAEAPPTTAAEPAAGPDDDSRLLPPGRFASLTRFGSGEEHGNQLPRETATKDGVAQSPPSAAVSTSFRRFGQGHGNGPPPEVRFTVKY